MHTNKRTSFFLIFLFSIIYSSSAYADQEYYYKQISLNEGLTQSTVRCILNDHRGFIWIGTKSGLNRFDRYELKSYFFKKESPNSLPGNQINFIYEDKFNNIWIATDNGLARYNPQTDDFTSVLFKNKPLIVGSVLEFNNAVWFGGSGHMYKFDLQSKTIQDVDIVSKENISDMFTGMKLWNDNALLLRTRRNGVWMFNLTKKLLTRVSFLKDKEIMSMYIDSKKQVWIAPYGAGIKGYNQLGLEIGHYNTSNSKLSNNVILDIVEKDGRLWLGTDGGGISIFDPNGKNFDVLKHIPSNSSSLLESSILTLYNDKENNIWAGSIRGGLIAIKPVFFHTYREAPLNSSFGLSEKTVLSLYEDKQKMVWVGTDGGGINKFNPVNMTFEHYPATYGYKIASISEFSNNELLLSVFSKGLFIFNKSNGSLAPFLPEITKEKLALGLAINLEKVFPDDIYLFTDQILRYSISSKKVSIIPGINAWYAQGSLMKIYSDDKISLLFGSYGIFTLNHANKKLSAVFRLTQRDNPLTAACQDINGTFWLGNRDGLMYYNASQKKLIKITTNLFDGVSSIVVDSQNRLWIGARNMIFLYLIKENKFVSYGESDGVIPNEFLFKPSLVATNGDIYMGGVKGLLHINKSIPAIPASVPVIELIGLELNGVPLNHSLKDNENVVSIPWNHSSLIVRIMARENDVFRKKMFRFKIDGLDFKSVETYDHTLTIGSLPQGQYRIMVSSSLKNGGWSMPVQVLKITITPPWFASFWFIGLVLIIMAAIIIFFYRMAIAKKNRKLQWDMKEHEQQTYEAKIRFLINISHELRTPLTLIYSPLQRILKNKNVETDLQEKLGSIYKQANHMREIIDMVLDVRKIELGRERLKLETQPINLWVKEVVDNFKGEFEAKKINICYDLDEQVENFVFDIKKCEIVLTNLLINALKFSPEETRITVSTKNSENFLRIAISDQGIGLQNIDSKDLFKTFYQGSHAYGGSGIGLSFSKILIEMHGGHIAAYNNEDGGATFYFELPYKNTELVLSENEDTHGESIFPINKNFSSFNVEDFSTINYSIIIVEDEPNLRAFLVKNLTPVFRKVYEAENGLEALEILNTQSIDIIVSDVMMPEIDGFELCKRLKENLNISHIPIVLLTTQGDLESRQLGYKLGADFYIPKPFDLDFLQTILSNLLKNRGNIKAKFKQISPFINPTDGTFSSADEKFMTKLNSLILDNMETSELHVEFLIDKMAMSRASLYSKLKNIADIGVNDYINKLRLEKAAHLLCTTDKTIVEITDIIGFANQRYFSTVFKQYYKTTPTQYRKDQNTSI